MIGCGKKVQFISPWQTYRVGDVIEPTAMDRDWLLANGYVKDVATRADEAEPGGRPARFARKALDKVKSASRDLLAP